jgi:hypothetical protein
MRGYLVDGWWWVGCEIRGRLYLLRRVARVGDLCSF